MHLNACLQQDAAQHSSTAGVRRDSSSMLMCVPPAACLQDAVVLSLRRTIASLRQDCRSLAGAITQMSTGANVSEVLQALPPTLLQVGSDAQAACSACMPKPLCVHSWLSCLLLSCMHAGCAAQGQQQRSQLSAGCMHTEQLDVRRQAAGCCQQQAGQGACMPAATRA